MIYCKVNNEHRILYCSPCIDIIANLKISRVYVQLNVNYNQIFNRLINNNTPQLSSRMCTRVLVVRSHEV